jgi:hypothetical protein
VPLGDMTFAYVFRDLVLGINIAGYPTDGKIRHLVHLLKPHRRGPGKTNPLKTLTTCQSPEAESQPSSRPSLAERSWVR